MTYHLPEKYESAKESRREREKTQREDGDDVPFPGWERLRDERLESGPALLLLVRDQSGDAIRAIPAEATAGLHRTAWDLRHPPIAPVDLEKPGFQPPWVEPFSSPSAF